MIEISEEVYENNMPVSSEFTTKQPGSDYPDIPEGHYTLEVYDITEVEQATYDTRNKPEDEQLMETQLKCEFAILDDVKIDEENTTRGRRIWRYVTPYITYPKQNKKGSNLYWLLRGVYGSEAVSKGRLLGDDINDLIGMQFVALIRSQEGSNGKKYPTFDLNATTKATKLGESYLNDPKNPSNMDEDIADKDLEEIFDEA